MSLESLTAGAQGRRAAKAKRQEEGRGKAAPFAAITVQLPRVQQALRGKRGLRPIHLADARAPLPISCNELPFLSDHAVLLAGFSLINGYFAGQNARPECLPGHVSDGAEAVRARRQSSSCTSLPRFTPAS